jgi:serine/threonine-protein kinase
LAACKGESTTVDNALADLPTAAVLPSATDSPSPEFTQERPTLPGTFTAEPQTATVTETETITVTPSNTITDTPTKSPTPTATETLVPNAINSLAELARNGTVFPVTFVLPTPFAPTPVLQATSPFAATPPPSSRCQYLPPGGFGQIFLNEPSIVDQLGCPVGAPPVTASISSASQPFERGSMLWLNESGGVIYALKSDGTFLRVNDTYNSTIDPESGGETPPAGLLEPIRGFGKVWRTVAGVRDALGWARTGETGGTAVMQDFVTGRMLYLPSRGDIIILTYQGSPASGVWRAVQGTF